MSDRDDGSWISFSTTLAVKPMGAKMRK